MSFPTYSDTNDGIFLERKKDCHIYLHCTVVYFSRDISFLVIERVKPACNQIMWIDTSVHMAVLYKNISSGKQVWILLDYSEHITRKAEVVLWRERIRVWVKPFGEYSWK